MLEDEIEDEPAAGASTQDDERTKKKWKSGSNGNTVGVHVTTLGEERRERGPRCISPAELPAPLSEVAPRRPQLYAGLAACRAARPRGASLRRSTLPTTPTPPSRLNLRLSTARVAK
jgi:hypothetical protein